MIYDTIENAEIYYGISPFLKKGLEYLKNTNLASLPEGKIEIDGDNVFALVSKGRTKPHREAKMEAHRKYIDIQYNIDSREDILCWFLSMTKGVLEEHPEKDLWFYDSPGRPVTVGINRFAVLFPADVHAPGLTHRDLAEYESNFKKIVIKVKV